MIKAYRYGGVIYLKFGRKASPGVMYSWGDVESGIRPDVELWRDGTVTFHDRPEGTIDDMTRVPMPAWAYGLRPRRFKSRS